MKTLLLLSVVISLSAHAQDSRKFEATGPLVIVTEIDRTVKAEEDALVGAREAATKKCQDAGCTTCSNPSYKTIVQDYSAASYQFQYAVTLTGYGCSAKTSEESMPFEYVMKNGRWVVQHKPVRGAFQGQDCIPPNRLNSATFDGPNSYRNPIGDCGIRADGGGGGAGTSGGGAHGLDPQNPSKIPGDGDGTGRRND